MGKRLLILIVYPAVILLGIMAVIALFYRTPALIRTSPAVSVLWVLAVFIVGVGALWLIRRINWKPNESTFLLLLAVLAVIPRLFWVLAADTVPISDFQHIHEYAVAASKGLFREYVRFYELFPFKFNFGLLLAALYKVFSAQVMVVKLFNVFLSILMVLLIYWIGKMVFGHAAGRVAGFLAALWPAQIMYCSVVASEHVFMVFLLLGTGLFLRVHKIPVRPVLWGGMAASGLCLALAQLIRPMATLMLPVFAVYLLLFVRIYNKRLSDLLQKGTILAVVAGSFFLTLAAINGPVEKLTGIPAARSSSGFNLLVGTNFTSNGMYNDQDFSIIEEYKYDYEKVHGEATKRAIERIRTRPAGFAKLVLRKFGIMWSDEYYGYYWSTLEMQGQNAMGLYLKNSPGKLAALAQGYYVLILIFGAVGCVQAVRRNNYPAVILVLVLEGLVAAYSFLEVQSRYHFTAIPFLLMAAGFGMAVCMERMDSMEKRRKGL